MFFHSTYGFLTKSIKPLAQELAEVLQLEWQERDSAAWGDYYLWPPFNAETDKQLRETFKLYLNHRRFEGWKNPQFKNCNVLLNVTSEHPFEVDRMLFSTFQGQVMLVQRDAVEGT